MLVSLRLATFALAMILPLGAAMAQSNPLTGRDAGVVHGEGWGAGRQELNGPSGSSMTRTERLRRQSAQYRKTQRDQEAARRRAAQQQPTPRPRAPGR